MRRRGSVSARFALVALPAVGSAFSLPNPASARRAPGTAPTRARAVTTPCSVHDVPTILGEAGLECTKKPRHFVCESCGGDIGRRPGVACPACSGTAQ